jgi:DNA gyrase/topoisomerase IV subunit B
MGKTKENKITQLTDREHCLLRPGQYIGASVLTKSETFILNKKTETFEYKEVEYVPGFLKIIYEILDNSVDEAIRTNYKFATNISLNIDLKTNKITVSDDGRGIPLDNADGTNISQLELALTELRAGSNFDDEAGRTLLGMNGVGSSLTNVFSKEFEAIVFDKKRKGHLKCSDNLSNKSCKITDFKSDKSGTTVSFIPDLKRFGLKKIDSTHIDLIYQRIMFLSFTYPEIKFKFNNKLVKFKSAKNIMTAFAEKFVTVQDDNTPCKFMIGVIPNNNDDFTHKSYINGADCLNGGNHLDYVHSELIPRIKNKLAKKYSTIKPGDIKNKLSYVIIFREFLNPAFNSQTKENFSSDVNAIKQFLTDIDWDNFANKICKCSEIIEPIVESFKIKEELKNRQTLAKIGKTTSKFKCKKFLPATKENKYMGIVEGDSASAGLSAGLGRSQIGYFSTRGVPLNTLEVPVSKIAENEELNNLIKCLGLKLGSETQNLTYENILLSEDADCLHESTYVLTKRGNIQIKDIIHGDEVLTHTFEWKPVIALIEKKKTNIINIEINGDVLCMSENHKMPVIRNYKEILVTAKEILPTDMLYTIFHDCYLLIPITKIEHKTLSEPETFVDITVKDNHTFCVHLEKNNLDVVSHNCDGSHIAGLYIAFFYKYAPSIIKEGRLKKLRTPIICLRDKAKKIKEMFFTFDEYNEYILKNPNHNYNTHYYKGLGSWKESDLKELVTNYGLETFIETLSFDEETEKLILDWCSKKNSEVRKEYLRNNKFSIFGI